jgi:hypothetical protein
MTPLARRTSVVSAIAIVVLGACSSSSEGAADAGPVNNGDDAIASGDDGGGCPARPATTCDVLTMSLPNYQAGINGTPAGFPPPPAGSTLCGTEGIGGLTTTEILLSADDSSTLLAYYSNALMVMGYTVMSPVTDQDCGVTLNFVINSPEAAAPLAGSLVWLPDAQAFEINNPN